MIKKIICILLVCTCVFTFSVSRQNVDASAFAISGTAATIIASVIASILISAGIGYITGTGSAYQDLCEALGNDLVQYVNTMDFSVINGNPYVYFTATDWQSILGWIGQTDWNDLHYLANSTISAGDFINYSDGIKLSDYDGYYSLGSKYNVVSLSHLGYSVVYSPTGYTMLSLSDGTSVKYSSSPASSAKVVGLVAANTYGTVLFGFGARNQGGGMQFAPSVDDSDYIYSGQSWGWGGYGINLFSNSLILPGSETYHTLTSQLVNNVWTVKLDNQVICRGIHPDTYRRICLKTGVLLCNVENPDVSINTNSDGSEVSVPADIEFMPPVYNEPINDGAYINLPIKATITRQGSDTPLTKDQIKDAINDGETLVLNPEMPAYDNQSFDNVPVLITQAPAIPKNNDTPVIVPGFPDVINPGASDVPDITVTANADVFPTAAETPSESVSSGEGVTGGESSTAQENVSEIVSEAVQDIAEPLSPADVERGSNRLKLPQLLISKFPFCIPFDLYNSLKVFDADAEAPCFEIPIEINSLGFNYTVTVDLGQYETVATIVRWFFSVSWIVGLILITRKVIWK